MDQLYGEFDFLLINVIEKVVPTKISTIAVMISKTDIITSEILHSSRYENYLTAKQMKINARYIIYRIEKIVCCDMKIMSLRNGGDFGKQLFLRTRCLLNHHHSFVT